MYSNFIRSVLAAVAICVSQVTQAGLINGGDLLDQPGASFLEERLSLGDLNFTNISDLSAGALASTWRSDVLGYTDVISIYDVSFQGNNYLIGGYSTIGHSGVDGYSFSSAATANNFLFNLSLGVVDNTQNPPWSGQYDQFDRPIYFASFGAGHDLFGGVETLGRRAYIHGSSDYGNGYSYGGGDHLLGSGITGYNLIEVNGLESFVFASAVSVPEPSSIVLFGIGLIGLGFSRKRKKA